MKTRKILRRKTMKNMIWKKRTPFTLPDTKWGFAPQVKLNLQSDIFVVSMLPKMWKQDGMHDSGGGEAWQGK